MFEKADYVVFLGLIKYGCFYFWIFNLPYPCHECLDVGHVLKWEQALHS